MKTVLSTLTFFAVCILHAGCTNGIPPIDYFNYFNSYSEGSYIQQSQNGFVYQLQHRSAEFMALNELKGDGTMDFSEVSSLRKKYAEGENFCLRIKSEQHEDVMRKNLQSEDGYFKRIEMLSTYFPLMVAGISGTDTIPCQFHHFERTYTVQPFIQVLFSLEDGHSVDKIIFTDAIFNNGETIALEHITTYIEELPILKL